MSKLEHRDPKVVQLAEGVLICTAIDSACIPALRSGFAGYPVNPRWSGIKFHAWKTGRLWRQAVQRGEMVVRSTDSMLVVVNETDVVADDTPSPRKWGISPGLIQNPNSLKCKLLKPLTLA